MGTQRLNRYNKKHARVGQGAWLCSRPIQDVQTGFIQHPPGYPIEVRRKWLAFRPIPDAYTPRLGIMFDSEKYVKPGSLLEVSIPMPGKVESFNGQVILVRHKDDYYQIGLWLYRAEDASRARIVEQICHIERYLQEKKYREGPYNLNPERVASEWIAKYAGGVPTL